MNIVWFNGPSARRFLDIAPQKVEIGCNFIMNNRPVHHVCAYDRQCVEKIPNKKHVQFWTRSNCVDPFYPHFKYFESETRYLDSGTMALCVASKYCDRPVYVIGCDWGESNGSIYDNLYTWRSYQPGKQTSNKLNLITKLAEQNEFIFVHERSKNYFGDVVQWISPAAFLKLTA